MNYEIKFSDWKERIEEASNNTQSASAAAAYLGIKFDTYKKYAQKYGCYKTNQSGKGISKQNPLKQYSLKDILNGKYPEYQSNKLRKRLLQEDIFPYICNNCLNEEWLGNPIPLELNHINGQNNDHRLENLELLCPNCHALTSTYRGKNKGVVAE